MKRFDRGAIERSIAIARDRSTVSRAIERGRASVTCARDSSGDARERATTTRATMCVIVEIAIAMVVMDDL